MLKQCITLLLVHFVNISFDIHNTLKVNVITPQAVMDGLHFSISRKAFKGLP